MKKILTSIFLLLSVGLWAQTKVVSAKASPQQSTNNPSVDASNLRNGNTSVKVSASDSAPVPYDVNDIYMGRKDEILSILVIKEIPADFPKYEKQWSVADYNAVIDAYYMNHIDILQDKYKEKINAIKNR